jgi:hypothetical protein
MGATARAARVIERCSLSGFCSPGGADAAKTQRRDAVSVKVALRSLAWLPLTLALAPVALRGGDEARAPGLALEGEEAEEFLRTAELVDKDYVGEGITNPELATLTDGTRTLRAIWKTVNEHKPGQARMETGWEFDFRDQWKAEVMAYELDKLLGLRLVPPTVERRLDGRIGSLQLWVEEAINEEERRERGLKPPVPPRYNFQLHSVRLLHQLTYNTDFRNIHNVIVDPSFRVYAIDNSRAFRIQTDLQAPDDLQCFSRAVIERLKALDRALLEEKLGPWIEDMQIDGLLARRDAILAICEERIKENGPGNTLY